MKRRKRRKPTKNRHHRKPRCQGGSSKPSNLSKVPIDRHKMWHTMFSGHMTPEQIVDEINRLWIDPDVTLYLVRNET